MKTIYETYGVEINEIGRTQWTNALNAFEDANLNQSWGYGIAKWGTENIDHVVLKKEGIIVSLAQVARLRFPFFRTGIAYVTWGPLWKKPNIAPNDASYQAMVEALKEEYVRRRRFLLRIKPYGFECRDAAMRQSLEQAGFWPTKGILGTPKKTILIDLSPTPEELRKKLKKKWRNSLTNSEKMNLQIREEFTDLPLRRIGPLYESFLRKKKIKGWDLGELIRIQSQLEGHEKMRVTTCESGGTALAASICSAIGKTVIGLVGVSSPEGREKRAYYLLQWDEILWARSIGKGYYDLSGISPLTNPTVYHFKSGLNGDEVTFLCVYDCYRNKAACDLICFLEKALKSRSIQKGVRAFQATHRSLTTKGSKR